jgi:hypothetical protein
MNQAARRALADTAPSSWLAVLEKLIDEYWSEIAFPLNRLEPRLPCTLNELLPPEPLAELLRRAFAPDLKSTTFILLRCLNSSADQLPALLGDWQKFVIDPFAEYLDAKRGAIRGG